MAKSAKTILKEAAKDLRYVRVTYVNEQGEHSQFDFCPLAEPVVIKATGNMNVFGFGRRIWHEKPNAPKHEIYTIIPDRIESTVDTGEILALPEKGLLVWAPRPNPVPSIYQATKGKVIDITQAGYSEKTVAAMVANGWTLLRPTA